MKSKIGFHIDISTHWGEPEKIIRADTRVIKVISSMALLQDFHHALGDKVTFIARDFNGVVVRPHIDYFAPENVNGS